MHLLKTYFNLFQVKIQIKNDACIILILVIKMYERIRAMRTDKDLTQTQVAEFLGMSQTGYSKYETGENDIPTDILVKLAKFYNTTTDYLLGLTDEP